MISKSLFSSNINNSASMIYPLGNPNNNSFSSSSLLLSSNTLNAINTIHQYYTSNMSNKKYSNIPNDYESFLRLYNTIAVQMSSLAAQSALESLLQITEEGLIGSMNSFGLNYTNNELMIENHILQKKIEEILSGQNKVSAVGSNTGNLTIKKTFTLAPLFSYYIMFYGMPDRGVGFDPLKISSLLAVMDKYGIDPYQ